ncbi:MAG TPA: MBL fold metallo-hydrolase [Chroococcales cyanobacterium]
MKFVPVIEQLNASGCKTYLVASGDTDEAWLIDPVLNNLDQYLNLLASRRLKLTTVIDTHTHADHLSACPKLVADTNCAYIMHEHGQPRGISERIKHDAVINMGSLAVKVLHTPGHTRDSICLVFPDQILTGDTLFLDEGGAGRVDLPGGDAAEHFESLTKLRLLPDHLVVHPGHDYKNRRPSSLAQQKAQNPFLSHTAKQRYVDFITELKLGPAEWMNKVIAANCHGAHHTDVVEIPQEGNACEVQGTLGSCAGSGDFSFLEPEELAERMAKSDRINRSRSEDRPNLSRKDIHLIDVRESVELTGVLGHIPGITHIPVGTLSQRLASLEGLQESEIVLICKMGGRAKTAAEILSQAGFKKLAVMSGGMSRWKERGLPVTRLRDGSEAVSGHPV